MIADLVDQIRFHKRLAAISATGAVLLIVAGVVMLLRGSEPRAAVTAEELRNGKVEHVRGGSKVILDKGEEVIYAGIRAPYSEEPLAEESQKRNADLVGGKKVRLRFDDNATDKKDRFVAYVFVDGAMVNELLVREGLAFVQLTSDHRRFKKELLAAQADARKNRRGVWKRDPPPKETHYPADPKYGNFHRPGCEEVPKIKPERLTTFESRTKAFDAGFAPCPKCNP